MGAAHTADRPPQGSREMQEAQRRCEVAVVTLSASRDMLLSTGGRHLSSAQAERARSAPTWRANALAAMRKYKKCTADAANISTKIRVLEQHIGMIREQELNAMVTDVFKSSSVAMAKSSRTAASQLRGVDNANNAFNDLLDRMTDVTEAIGEAGLNEADAEADSLLEELDELLQLGDSDRATAPAAEEQASPGEAARTEGLMLDAPTAPAFSDAAPPPAPPPARPPQVVAAEPSAAPAQGPKPQTAVLLL